MLNSKGRLSFRLDLIAYKGPVNELLYEYGVTEEQYKKIMDLMDALREKSIMVKKYLMVSMKLRLTKLCLTQSMITILQNLLQEHLWKNGDGKKYSLRYMEVFLNIGLTLMIEGRMSDLCGLLFPISQHCYLL